ncbi:hypothetical protein AXG93_4022s1030 [Marchantia polymorpha subsp. ruderalis]|uniref:Oleosin n=1 Tax=Marchantia polymorpha subsp. ruderalis TaxID=1480154 RepID=A0A176W0P6_MARPO|nr:hypothetical protein AXG93_4022s1030 [Marchantia polymorpha subsp. ruderalis]
MPSTEQVKEQAHHVTEKIREHSPNQSQVIGLVTIITAILLLLTIGGGFGLAAYSASRWLYEYVKGRHPVGSDRVDAAKSRLVDTASHLKERASGYVHGVQESAQHAKDRTVDAATT